MARTPCYAARSRPMMSLRPTQHHQGAPFSAAWRTELNTIPATTSEIIHLVSGLILPLWTTLPFHTVRVYRLQTDDGTRLIGRVVDQQWLDRFTQTPADTPNIHHAWPRLERTTQKLPIDGGASYRKLVKDLRSQLFVGSLGETEAVNLVRGLCAG